MAPRFEEPMTRAIAPHSLEFHPRKLGTYHPGVGIRRVTTTWPIPGGGSPDMGNVSIDGKLLWLSVRRRRVRARYDDGSSPANPCWQGTAWPHGVALARPLLAGPHREHALERG